MLHEGTPEVDVAQAYGAQFARIYNTQWSGLTWATRGADLDKSGFD